LLPEPIFRPDGFDLMHDDDAEGFISKMSRTSGAPLPMSFWENSGPELRIEFMCVQRFKSQIGGAKEQFTDRRFKEAIHRSAAQKSNSQIGMSRHQDCCPRSMLP
jgi:hypothetical protein